jgi:hypothetical protein
VANCFFSLLIVIYFMFPYLSPVRRRPVWRQLMRLQRRSGIPSGGWAGILLSWEAVDCSCLVSKQETKAVTIVGIFVHSGYLMMAQPLWLALMMAQLLQLA